MAGYIGSRAVVATSGVERKKTFAITTTTTSLTGLDYTPNHVHVFHNGIRLVDGTDYTATNGTSIILVNAAQNGDEVVVVSYSTFSPADIVPASTGGTFSGSVAVDGNLTVDTDTLFVDSVNNRVGIGTSLPSEKLHVDGVVKAANGLLPGIYGSYLYEGASNAFNIRLGTSGPYTEFVDAGSGVLEIGNAGGVLALTAYGTERMRIDGSGNVLVGTTGLLLNNLASAKLHVTNTGNTHAASFKTTSASGFAAAAFSRNGNDGAVCEFFHQDNNLVGSVSVNSTSTSYNTSSDYRLKEDVQPMVGASDRVLALKPVNFAWKSDGTRVDGFLAHEAQEVVPEAVHGVKDGMRTEEYEVTPAVLDNDGNVVAEAVMGTREVPDYQGIDQSKLVPLLTAALQEALGRIETLEADVAALKGATNV